MRMQIDANQELGRFQQCESAQSQQFTLFTHQYFSRSSPHCLGPSACPAVPGFPRRPRKSFCAIWRCWCGGCGQRADLVERRGSPSTAAVRPWRSDGWKEDFNAWGVELGTKFWGIHLGNDFNVAARSWWRPWSLKSLGQRPMGLAARLDHHSFIESMPCWGVEVPNHRFYWLWIG